ncbi:hypothetical protein PLICRDRAFT_207863 [Plicaturopsis crispa FD-325 SS-3]|nr:hypothetical protein PLICRDRAFT_207863 [Plicaturopsis crispa FD-325 SS-3]
MQHLFTPNHVQLVSACYPPTAALLTSGPDYRPNSQELSRLTYYAANRPGKVTKIGSELEKRAKTESRKAQAGNTRSRAALLITLAIFKALATECRRDISLLSATLLSSLDTVLACLPADLEVGVRSASVFTAWTTYTDGHLVGVDATIWQYYISTLRRFASLGAVEAQTNDHEVRNRTRLIGLAALTGSVNSEALYNTTTHFQEQVSTILRPILLTLLQASIPTLTEQAASLKDSPISPYLDEFRTRPAMERRALSIHIHKDGDNGPSTADVTNACLRALTSMLGHSTGGQLGWIMQAAFGCLDELKGWDKLDHCCWIAVKACEWAQYQYRYAVPTRLVERLVENQDAPSPTSLHKALAAMIAAVFTSPIPLVNLSTSDIISNLITLILRRVAIDPEDPLLPALVDCIAALGTHVYYSDQIQDLAGELINRLALLEVQGFGRGTSDKCRTQAIRCLLAGLLGLMQAADQHDAKSLEADEKEHKRATGSISSILEGGSKAAEHAAASTGRSRVSPDTWQETMSLVCDGDFAVRSDYADVLLAYIKDEIPKRGDFTDSDGVKRVKPLAEGPLQHAATTSLLVHGDSTTRSLHAMHAYMYVLATSSSLGLDSISNSMPSSREEPNTVDNNVEINVLPATPLAENAPTEAAGNRDSPPQSQRQGRRSVALPRSRKVSTVQRLLDHVPPQISASATASASDYAYITMVLTAVHENLPARGLLTGVPMLLALDGATRFDASEDPATLHRLRAVKEVIARVWLAIGQVWACTELADMAQRTLSSMPGSSLLPPVEKIDSGLYHPPRQPIHLPSDADTPAEPWTGLDIEAALMAIVSCQNAQDATGLDRQGLLRRFAYKWTPESALKESVSRQSSHEAHRGEGVSPLLKISPALMHIENMSLQSLARPTRGVGVTDLREALEGRSSMSNLNLGRPQSISTLDHTSVTGSEFARHPPSRAKSRKRPPSAAQGDVRDVLSKLGIGKPNGNNNLLKASFPSLQKNDQSSSLTPPYKS